MISFPDYSDSSAKVKIADLERLLDRSLTNTQYVDGRRASQLIGVVFTSFREAILQGFDDDEHPLLSAALEANVLFKLTLSAVFDLVTNAEYLHGRMVNSKWIYCHRDGEPARAYFSFLKQCPRCCLDKGLEARLSGAQHKPTSHHIGEITTVVTALILELLAAANDEPLAIATITRQSHDVDAVGFRDDLLVLFEIKASPMVTFPVVAELDDVLLTDESGELKEYRQHSLIDVPYRGLALGLAIPHRDWLIDLGAPDSAGWPYEPLIKAMREPGTFLSYLSAWIELYNAYRVPKTQRTAEQMRLSYLVNGWGDEIDSNKTKPGLGRTDDIKKGTYQLLKFGSYYRDDKASVPVRGALIANMDPLFLRENYIDGLIGVRWGHEEDFALADGIYSIAEGSLKYLYDSIVAFNAPIIQDPILKSVFDFDRAAQALLDGKLDELIRVWMTSGPDKAVELLADEQIAVE